MKNKLLSIVFLVGCALCSCDDVLDALPEDKLPEETFWQTYIPALSRWNMKCILVSMKRCLIIPIWHGRDGIPI